MKRPIGLILSGIVLSVAAFLLTLITGLSVLAGRFADHNSAIGTTPATTPHFFIYLMLTVAVFYAALATWATLTIIGILRLRPRARYSILIIRRGLAVLALLAGMGTLVSLARVALPRYQSNWQVYSIQIMRSMPVMPGQAQPPVTYS